MDSKYPIPPYDYSSGTSNPHYPDSACANCCESNSPAFYGRSQQSSEKREKLRNERVMWGVLRCPVCKRIEMTYHTSSYAYPEFHLSV